MIKLNTLLILIILSTTSFAQPNKWNKKKHFTVVSYNVENLFDTIDTPHKNDTEFTPLSTKKWNNERYLKKIDALSFVLSEINKNELPELIGLVEVENETGVKDLASSAKLKEGNYSYIIEDGPDPRGIDCALLYRSEIFKYLMHKSIQVRFPFANNQRTRDILYVKGLVKKDTIHVFINHWSSRRGGMEKSEPKRLQSAQNLKAVTDSILLVNAKANIIIMGDFNDEPNNKSMHETLQAGTPAESLAFTNLVYENFSKGEGTYYYKKNFNMLDHLILNNAFINKKKGFRPIMPEAYIFKPDTICYTNKNGDKSPGKTYGGKNYYGGFSDHFPIYTYFYQK